MGSVLFSFEDFCLDPDRQELRRAGEHVSVEPQILDLLFYLVRNRARVVSKDDLIADVWQGRIVSDSTLTSRIASARKTLGDSGSEQRLVRTVARKGIRFIGEVSENDVDESARPERSAASDAASSLFPGTTPPALPDKPSLAVLPFRLIGGEAEHSCFVDGLVDDIITGISRCRDFFVIARNTSFSYKGRTPIDARQVGRELGVGYVIEGTTRFRDGLLRVVADLVETSSGRQVWSEVTERTFSNSFGLQDEIANALTAAMQTQILLSEGMLSFAKRNDELRRNDLLNRAWQRAYKLSESGLRAGRTLAEEVIRDDGENARAHLVLAFTMHHLAYLGFEPDRVTAFGLALEHGRKAVRLEPDSEYNHWILGSSLSQVRLFSEALTHLRRATEINANFSLAHGSWGTVLAWLGQYEEAIAKTELALRLNPRDPANFLRHFVMALAKFGLAQYREAAHWADIVTADRPRWYLGHLLGAAALGLLGEGKMGNAMLRNLLEAKPEVAISIVDELPFGNPEISGRLRRGLHMSGLRPAKAKGTS